MASGSARDQKGVVIVELLIFMFVASLLVAVLGFFVSETLTGRTRGVATLEIQENARLALERVANEIREAKDIDTAASTFDINLASASGTSKKISFTMTSSTLNPTEFDVSGGALRIRQGSGATLTPFTSGFVRVTNFTARNYTSRRARNVDLELTVEYALSATGTLAAASTTVRESVTLRNR